MEAIAKGTANAAIKKERALDRLKITEDRVRRLPLMDPAKDKYPVIYLDSELRGFMVIAHRESKSYYVQADVHGKTVRVKIERTDRIDAKEARERAAELLVEMRKTGRNPNEVRRERAEASFIEDETRNFTLREAVDLHLNKRRKVRSEKTITEYQKIFDTHLRDWMDRPVTWIGANKAAIVDLHDHITKHGWDTSARKGRGARPRKGSPYAANGMVRALRATYNWAKREKPHLGLPDFPNVELNPESSSDEMVPLGELKNWFDAVMALKNTIRRDAHLFVMFTGLRLDSAMSAEWKNVDWENKCLFVPRPKGGKERAFWMPLSPFLIGLLERRRADIHTHAAFPDTTRVFPTTGTKKDYIADLREKHHTYLKQYSAKDYRHSFGSFGAACGVQIHNIRFLLNHKQEASSVTFRYAKALMEPMSEDLKTIHAYMFKKIGISEQKTLDRLVAVERKIA